LTISEAASSKQGIATEARARQGLAPAVAWLFTCCAMIFLMVVVGGITRLTLSGLSITEWKPVIGVIPPLSLADWAAEFTKYKQVPEYQAVHYAISLAEFKSLYYWEYFHRLLGRLIGLAFAVPFAWFLVRGLLPRRLILQLAGILLLGFAQGGLGWYMVESGLVDRVEVSQYRLVAHLALALAIYSAILWIALGIVRGTRSPLPNHPPQVGEGRVGSAWRRGAEATLALVALTIAAGGFVAGTRAGLTYNTFPLMDGGLVPAGYDQLHPFYMNWFENIAAVQFDHRVLAMASFAVVLSVWVAGLRSRLPNPARTALHILLAATALQVTLGISTLILVVPIPLAAAHQAGALVLLTAAIFLRHTLRPAVMDRGARATI
jgi:heme a synthase